MKEQLLAKLQPFSQQHLLRFWDEIDQAGQNRLAEQIDRIDFAEIADVYEKRNESGNIIELANRAKEPTSFRLGDAANRISPEAARQRGVESLAAGELAVLLVAGGQGTRLGFDHPKGMYPVGPVSDATLFQIHVEKIIALGKRHGVKIPFCLMTSPATHDETVEYFAKNDRFGLDEDDLMIFCQGTMPAIDMATGKLLLGAKDSLALSPDGHGGTLAALDRSGVLDKLSQRGIRQLFYFQVDNPLVDIGSSEFLGYHLLAGSELSSEVIAKQDPMDRVGNVVEIDGNLHVIEYSDLPVNVANRRRDDGSLEVWAGSIAIHVMDFGFLKRQAATAGALPFHIAKKKVPYLDESGNPVKPTEPNAIKLERFIFDLLPSAANAIVVEVDSQEHFAPLKNAPGQPSDTPEAVKSQISALHTNWLQAAGATVAADTPVEISPLFALDQEEVARKVESGTVIDKPTYLT